jgi:hypothetical protein
MKPKIRKLTKEEIASGRYASTRGGSCPWELSGLGGHCYHSTWEAALTCLTLSSRPVFRQLWYPYPAGGRRQD